MDPELNKIWVICNYLVDFLPQLIPDKKTDKHNFIILFLYVTTILLHHILKLLEHS